MSLSLKEVATPSSSHSHGEISLKDACIYGNWNKIALSEMASSSKVASSNIYGDNNTPVTSQ
jgi:hypothetical protein